MAADETESCGAAQRRAGLHAALDSLLDTLPESREPATNEQAAALWGFVAALTHGRGLAERYHAEGIEAADATNPAGAASFNDRKRQRYHQAVLAKFLMDLCGDGRDTGPLPGNLELPVVIADLLTMMGRDVHGSGREPSEPQILRAARRGNAAIRNDARRVLVAEVFWRAGNSGESAAAVREDLLPGIPKRTWDDWMSRDQMDETADAERVAGAEGKPRIGGQRSDDEIQTILAVAHTAKPRDGL